MDLGALDFFEKAEITAQGAESTLNTFGYIPLISSTLSAPIRAGLGSIQIISGIVALPFMLLADLFSNHREEAFYRSGRAISQIAHGLGNSIRSAVEAIPVVGNIIAIAYDSFGNRMSYRVEESRPQLFDGVRNINPRLAKA